MAKAQEKNEDNKKFLDRFNFKDFLVMRDLKEIKKVEEQFTNEKIDEIELSYGILKVIINKIDGNDNKESYSNFFDNLRPKDFEILIKKMSEIVGQDKIENIDKKK